MFHFEKVISLGYNHYQDSVTCLYFDFEYLICGSHDTQINIWKFNSNYIEKFEQPAVPFIESDILTFNKLIQHHKSAVMSLTYDGIDSIISANSEGLILIIDITNGDLLKELSFTNEIEPITCIRLVGSLILATTIKGKVLFWNRKEDNLETMIKVNNDYTVSVNSIAFIGNRFYTAGSDCLIKEWDLQTLTCLRQFVAHDGPVLDLIAVENKLISCGKDRAIIWDFNKQKPSPTKKKTL